MAALCAILSSCRSVPEAEPVLWSELGVPAEQVHEMWTDDVELRRRYIFKDCDMMVLAAPGYDTASGRVAIAFGGSGHTPTATNMVSKDADAFRRKCMDAGMMVVLPYCGGNSWGSPESSAIAFRALEHLSKDLGVTVPERVPAFGFSMGGLAALNFARRYPERVSRVGDIFGAIDLEGMARSNKNYDRHIRRLYPNEAALYEATPFFHTAVLAQKPIAIYHGTADTIVPLEYSERLKKALEEAGGEVTLVTVEGMGHRNLILESIGDELLEFLLQDWKNI